MTGQGDGSSETCGPCAADADADADADAVRLVEFLRGRDVACPALAGLITAAFS